ncbi:3-hydroxybenzoate 6-monooxygenase [Aquicoccus porphyridii]|uniref:3-hydroxybenzoate 6-monooxygenase n=1 Tax=Aquicoccus porphyridii TaxID=1852029 RepID=A0A5A9ZHZ6_9RHOB|nr:3-hydroxybenzoate 6-monooxygenase [Aquicoccus porphyridii]KAA0916626.1 3-hydroxybenzoate 6-monooxygenase [Aquicoccus porphyridii]RAI53759.1 3-hydroxybenzoate 6-monooxygenase [Rhodobacteraceae bacterium AsT-22]
MTEDRVLIAGGGIGGMATAIGLAQKGIRSVVLEKSPELGEIGAGIQLGPNAFHAFDYLGVGDAAREMAVYIDNLRLMDAMSGDEITRIPLEDAFRKRFGNPYAVVHRGDLYGVFLRANRAHELVELRSGAEVIDYDQDAQGVTAILAGGARVRGRALIGADGLWSNIRKRVIGDGAPRVSGHTTYRSVIPTGEMPEDLRWNAATLWAGPKCHIVHYPLSGWKLFNLVVTYHNDAAEPVAGKPVGHDEVRKGFEHVAPVARQIIDKGKDWRLWVLCDRDPALNWVDGRVALLGDAAHPQLQYMAQGACMAMEDAVCLAAQVDGRFDDIEAVLQDYQAKRRLRTARIQLQSREVGNHVYHPEGAHAELRNAVMRARGPEEWYDEIAWLYGTTGLDGAVSRETMPPVSNKG